MSRDEKITSGGLSLEGRVHLPARVPAPGIVVCHPHPLYGGDMNNNVVLAVCEAATEEGFVSLRFNFRGVGASEGSFAQGEGERQDALAALDHLRRLPEVDGRGVLAGYSFGAAVALLAAPPGVSAVIAISTPTIAKDLSEMRVDAPVLLVVGGRDQVAPRERLAGLEELLPRRPEVVSIPEADHFWFGYEDELTAAVTAFLRRTVLRSEVG